MASAEARARSVAVRWEEWKVKLNSIARCAGVAAYAVTVVCPSLATAETPKILGVSWKDFTEERWSKYDKACMIDELKKHPNWSFTETDAQSSPEKQSADVQDLIAKKVNALIIVSISSSALKPSASEAVANGIPTIAYDNPLPVKGVFFVGFDAQEAGRIQSRALLNVKPEGRYVYIKGSPTMEVTKLFHEGQTEILSPLLKTGKIKIVGDQFVQDFNPQLAQDITEQILTANDNKVDAVVATNDGEAGGVIAALTAQGLVGSVAVSGQDGDIAALNRIAKGFQTVSAWKNACTLGRTAVDVAVRLANGEAPAAVAKGNRSCNEAEKICQDAVKLAPVSITRNNLNVMLDAHWITKDQLCAGVDQVPKTIHGINPPPACR
jgi:D-xylose transport system substrate-binding protein